MSTLETGNAAAAAVAAPAGHFFTDAHGGEPIRAELFGLDRLVAHARLLATHLQSAQVVAGRPLLGHFLQNRRCLILAHRQIVAAYRRGESFGPDAEWLLDNFHIVSEALFEIRTDLPRGYYQLLPKIRGGPLDGLPRVYALALELVAHCDSCLDEAHLAAFVQAFQTVTPLTIGELWAIPIMLRLVTVDNLRRLATQILRVRNHRQEAHAWAGRCLTGPGAPPPGRPDWSDAFLVQLMDWMHEQGAAVVRGVEWLESHLGRCGVTTDQVLRRERQRQASNQVSIGNCVTSLRLLSALDWPAFFERTSLVEAVLRDDPAGVYALQDFATRDRYRQEVERLSRGSRTDEVEVARRAVALAGRNPSDAGQSHVGYYLVAEGRAELEGLIRYRPKPRDRVVRFLLAHPRLIYFGGVAAVTLFVLALLAGCIGPWSGGAAAAALAVVGLLIAIPPASGIAVSLVNYWVGGSLPPRVLPKMLFKNGLPPDCTAFVVIPTLLVRPRGTASLLDHLEVHYLCNPDPNLRFALLTDFADAPAERMPEDEENLRVALEGIRALNERYPLAPSSSAEEGEGVTGDRFFLFHRGRRWNPAQGCWMGWERKRGKLSELNRLLRGARDTGYTTLSGDPARVPHVRYVITLDADTQLPHDAARRLIATLAHPLNRPRFDPAKGRVVAGYGVLQPRVSLTLTGVRKSHFARIFGGSAGIDPYTVAVSDLYQDLFGVGTFTGKGAYDVDAFEQAVGRTFPDNHILSHDLIEGNYARCGLVSDIELLDEFPASYLAFARREHRWARGDWQILPWLFPHVPAVGSEEGGVRSEEERQADASHRPPHPARERRTRPNPLPAVERWKIFDNLRRTLGPPALVLLLVLGWTVLPGPPWFWTVAAFVVVAWPLLQQLASVPFRMGQALAGALKSNPLPSGLGNTTAQALLSAAFLAEQARLLADAVCRTLYRLFVSRRSLLEWETAAAAEQRLGGGLAVALRTMWFSPTLAVVMTAVLASLRPGALAAAAPFLAAWLVAPFVAYWVSRPPRAAEEGLTPAEQRPLRRLARKTWNFFETFVGEEDNWLPPDNYQEEPREAVAHRTSPTNMGLYLVSSLAAHDFGYLSFPTLLERLEKTFATFDRLERSHGHFYNWYDTQTLSGLPPIYLSTVDSGNLLGCLVTLKQGLREKVSDLAPSPAIRPGLEDTLELAAEALRSLEPPGATAGGFAALEGGVRDLRGLLEEAPDDLLTWENWLRRVEAAAEALADRVEKLAQEIGEAPEGLRRWTGRLVAQAREHRVELTGLAPWLAILREMPARAGAAEPARPGEIHDAPAERWRSLRELLTRPFSVATLSAKVKSLQADLTALAEWWPDPAGAARLARVAEAVGASTAPELFGRQRLLAERAQAFAEEMDFKLLYSEGRDLFAVGYNLTNNRIDGAHYDLLASESALTSYLAVARGDVPKKHWFQLGRPLTRAAGAVTLLSWGGTMFEYLMPRLLLPSVPETLLDDSRRGAVARQIEYGRQRGVPWGVSESAFNVVDAALNYQYQAFGVPGLGLKRGLGKDLVIAPYATALAVMIQPRSAARNLQHLATEGADGAYGYYEAIDYTRERLQPKQRCAVVKCFMAHHQGMSLTALANALLGEPMPRRFGAEPMVRAAALLLQECMAPEAPLVQAGSDETDLRPAGPDSHHPMSRRLTTPHTAHPRTHLLSSGHYHVMVTNAGGGRATWHGLDVTRWREDRTRDDWGQFCYIRDMHTGLLWSPGYQPVGRDADEFEAIYSTDKAEFRRADGVIETHLEITVSPETHAEVRRLTLTNRDSRPHDLELTSYLEVVLASHAADLAHPAFGKLFLETEALAGGSALLCRRRPRSPEQRPVFAVHVVAVDGPVVGDLQHETDRGRFLGRGRTTAAPAALDPGAALSGTTGPVLDPIFSLRCRVRIDAEASVRVAFTTAAADTREEALTVADQYHDFAGVTRAFDLAWAHSAVELRHLHLSAQEAHLYQRLAAHVIYAGPSLRAAPDVLRANRQGQQGLWRYGISGDNPIVLVRVAEAPQVALVRQALAAHTYWRHKGLETDLLILNEDQSGYFEDFQNELLNLVRSSDERGALDKPGGVFVRKGAHLSADDRNLLLASARCVLAGDRGSLATQLDRLERAAGPARRPPRAPRRRPAETPAPADSAAYNDLLFDNGVGGFTPDGREYVVRMAPQAKDEGGRMKDEQEHSSLILPPSSLCSLPPAPWSNVVANPAFGFLVTERGGGYTWAVNSQQNRLTPWSNDPASDPPGEIVYLRDEATGELWTPTALTPRGPTGYAAHHGQGYSLFTHAGGGLSQELLLFVPPADPIKVIRLKVRNVGGRPRRLSATFYAEWVLGAVRDQAPMNVLTEIDAETGALFARNHFNADFGHAVAFADVNARPRKLTADRTEFLGRNGDPANPAALERAEWSEAVGPALDPCAALQTSFELKPGEETEVVFLLGEAAGAEDARRLSVRYREPGRAMAAFKESQDLWDGVLGAVQVRTPNPGMDLLLNRWLLYQVLSCRFWGRSAFYQSGGAFGFRDQLQDVLALVHSAPAETRAHLLRSASRQFKEGDVQHWWHPPRGAGVRTRCSDDYLWLPFAAAHYVSSTGDAAVLDERAGFIEAPVLQPGQEEDYRVPDPSAETATLYEHCVRSVEHGLTFGAHGLPLMGTGDWNDGMNRVGAHGRGESVWNGWFLLAVLREFAPLAEARGDRARAARWNEQAERLRAALEDQAWDGKWYRRAYFDDGTPLGSAENDECRIDGIAQSWAVISGGAEPGRARQAVAAADEALVRPFGQPSPDAGGRQGGGLILLFTPPFDKGHLQPGYIKGYLPGIRENGGQYTHGAVWLALAAAMLGHGKQAVRLFDLLNPIHHGDSREIVERYKTEPYVAAGDVYSEPPHVGRGGWSWYTGSASWLYRTALEYILGFRRHGDKLTLAPCVPAEWRDYEIVYRRGSATYTVSVVRRDGDAGPALTVDGKEAEGGVVDLVDDGRPHAVRFFIG